MQTFTGYTRAFRGSLLSTLLLLVSGMPSLAQRVLWTDTSPSTISKRSTLPLTQFRAVTVQLNNVRTTLRPAPTERSTAARLSGTVISLPLPDGTSERFRVVTVPVMDPELAARYPTIRTYAAQGIDDPTATARLDVSPAGLHVQILAARHTVYIDPAAPGDSLHHLVFDQSSMLRNSFGAVCQTPNQPTQRKGGTGSNGTALRANGAQLRMYRLAVACTGEYAATKGGTVAGALAGIVTSVNRVSGIYERELAIRLTLVPNTDRLIFLDGTTDPYSNNNGDAMLDQNQATTTRVIGAANYDIGHVFSTGGGGIAIVESVCDDDVKAMGVTGSAQPIGDAFDVDFVAHEMGHQFGAEHTFNGETGNCGGGNRTPTSAYEPGSGTTIMAYAGICGTDNLQNTSIPYFHSHSYDQILDYLATTSCGTITATGNRPPVVNAGANYSIPIGTPFVLTGTATDPDGDALTYSWEQFNLGRAGTPTTPQGDAPIFRVFAPTTSPSRTFPQLSDLLANTTTLGEQLPSYGRRLLFRFVARDNRMSQGSGGGVEYGTMQVDAIGTAGPFLVTAPNALLTTWQAGIGQQVTWAVANTTQAPINAATVDIRLSTDGGQTFPTLLLAAAPNNGSATVVLPPNTNTTQARIRVQATGNIFFDISNENFTVIPLAFAVYPNPSTGLFQIGINNTQTGTVQVVVFDAAGRVASRLSIEKTGPTLLQSLDLRTLSAGLYLARITYPGGASTVRLVKQ